jgi:hypothetical protein
VLAASRARYWGSLSSFSARDVPGSAILAKLGQAPVGLSGFALFLTEFRPIQPPPKEATLSCHKDTLLEPKLSVNRRAYPVCHQVTVSRQLKGKVEQ